MGGLLFGYDSAVINGAVGAIGAHFHASPATLGLAVSSLLIGAAVGALLVGWLADNYGRLVPMRLAALLFVFSALGAESRAPCWCCRFSGLSEASHSASRP